MALAQSSLDGTGGGGNIGVNSNITLTFTVPSGAYSAASWSFIAVNTANSDVHTVTSLSSYSKLIAANVSGAQTLVVTASSDQLLDINRAAGGTLSVLLGTAGESHTGAVTTANLKLVLTPSASPAGIPGPSQVMRVGDTMASELASFQATIGRNDISETNTSAVKVSSNHAKVFGDGTSVNSGLGHPDLEKALVGPRKGIASTIRYDTLLKGPNLAQFAAQESLIRSQLPAWTDAVTGFPSRWRFTSDGVMYHPLDAFLLRVNGLSGPGGSLAPTITMPTVTAATLTGGGLPNVITLTAPHIVFTFIGTYDWQETLPCADIAGVALTGAQNAYQLAGGGWTGTTVASLPPGTTKLRFYRTQVGTGAGGPYFWDQDVPLAGLTNLPAVYMTKQDALLKIDTQPPVWFHAPVLPETAAAFGMAYGSLAVPQGQQTYAPILFNRFGMISERNVVLSPSSGFLGVGNTAQSGQFATVVVAGASSLTPTAVGIVTTNAYAQNVQGFAGAVGIQARVTTPLAAAGTFALSYTYFDPAHGWGSTQTVTSATATFNGTAAGSTATFTIPSGRIVQTVGALSSVSGFSSATGAFVIEAAQARSY